MAGANAATLAYPRGTGPVNICLSLLSLVTTKKPAARYGQARATGAQIGRGPDGSRNRLAQELPRRATARRGRDNEKAKRYGTTRLLVVITLAAGS